MMIDKQTYTNISATATTIKRDEATSDEAEED